MMIRIHIKQDQNECRSKIIYVTRNDKKAFPIFYVDVTKTVYKSLRNILSFCIIETNQQHKLMKHNRSKIIKQNFCRQFYMVFYSVPGHLMTTYRQTDRQTLSAPDCQNFFPQYQIKLSLQAMQVNLIKTLPHTYEIEQKNNELCCIS